MALSKGFSSGSPQVRTGAALRGRNFRSGRRFLGLVIGLGAAVPATLLATAPAARAGNVCIEDTVTGVASTSGTGGALSIAGTALTTDCAGTPASNPTVVATNETLTVIEGGTLQFGTITPSEVIKVPIELGDNGGGTDPVTFDLNGQTLEIGGTSGVISDVSSGGAGVLEIENNGSAASTITLSESNTYTAATNIVASTKAITVKATSATSLGAPVATGGKVTIGKGNTLEVAVTGGAIVDKTIELTGTLRNSLANDVVIGADGTPTFTVLAASGATPTISAAAGGSIAITNKLLTADSAGGSAVSDLTIGSATDTGTVAFNGNSSDANTSWTGDISLAGGTLKIAGKLNIENDLVSESGTTFQISNDTASGSAYLAGTLIVDSGVTYTPSTSLDIVSSSDSTIAGVIAGAATFTKGGSGTVTFNGANTYTGLTTINAGELKLGADAAIRSGNTVDITGGSFNLNGFNPSLTVNLSGGTLTGGIGGRGQLSGLLNSVGGATISNVTGDAVFTQIRGTTTLIGANQFNGVTMNGGTIATTITGGGEIPITNTGGFDYNGGVLTVDASGITAQTGTWTVISGSVDEALARNTEVTFQGKTLKFDGFDTPIAGYALYDLYLKKGSLQFVSDRKSANDVCGLTGLCAGGYLNGSLDGVDKDAVAGVVRDVLMPSYEAGDLSLDFYTNQENLSKFVISGLMPRNVDAAGNSLANYNELLADTLFNRQPLRKFKTAETVAEASAVEAVETSSGDVVAEGVEVAAASTEVTEDPNLAAQYLEDDKWGAWVKGFGGDYKNDGEGTYVYRDYSATFGGVLLGVDYEVASDVRVGAYANNGYVSMSQSSGDYSGSGSWNPTGWGGGITASYTKPNFYVQGLFGASGFSGTQKRSLVASTIAAAQTIEAEKDVTSFIGSLRFGAPVELGKFILDPQLQATWTGNQESAFNEGTGGNAKLSYASRSTNFLQTELGAKLTMPINLGQKSEIVPNIRVAWLGDWGINGEGQQVGYSFTNRTATIDSENQNDMGVLIEGGVDYTIANTDSVSYKVYALGGVELFNNTGGTGWRASGGVKFNF